MTTSPRRQGVSYCASVSGNTATVTIKVPGVYADGDGRFFLKGSVFFSTQQPGDRITEISVVDIDNVLGLGANTTVANFTEKATMGASYQGLYVPPVSGYLDTDVANFGFIPSGLYLKVVGSKNLSLLETATMYVNVVWST